MTRVFIDSSVMIAAIFSYRSSARELLLGAVQLDLELVISSLVVKEVTRNIHRKRPDKLYLWEALLRSLSLTLVEPSLHQVKDVQKLVVAKDAPILAAAMGGGCRYLATSDQKHLLANQQLKGRFLVQVTTPDVILAAAATERVR